jgi:hypothetical protein
MWLDGILNFFFLLFLSIALPFGSYEKMVTWDGLHRLCHNIRGGTHCIPYIALIPFFFFFYMHQPGAKFTLQYRHHSPICVSKCFTYSRFWYLLEFLKFLFPYMFTDNLRSYAVCSLLWNLWVLKIPSVLNSWPGLIHTGDDLQRIPTFPQDFWSRNVTNYDFPVSSR